MSSACLPSWALTWWDFLKPSCCCLLSCLSLGAAQRCPRGGGTRRMLMLTGSQNHGTGEVGRDLFRWCRPPPSRLPLPPQAGSTGAGSPGPCPAGFLMSPPPLWATCSVLDRPCSKRALSCGTQLPPRGLLLSHSCCSAGSLEPGGSRAVRQEGSVVGPVWGRKVGEYPHPSLCWGCESEEVRSRLALSVPWLFSSWTRICPGNVSVCLHPGLLGCACVLWQLYSLCLSAGFSNTAGNLSALPILFGLCICVCFLCSFFCLFFLCYHAGPEDSLDSDKLSIFSEEPCSRQHFC